MLNLQGLATTHLPLLDDDEAEGGGGGGAGAMGTKGVLWLEDELAEEEVANDDDFEEADEERLTLPEPPFDDRAPNDSVRLTTRDFTGEVGAELCFP